MSSNVTVIMATDNNQGYAADQVSTDMTLADLLAAVQEAIDTYGEDAKVVTKDSGQRYGANFGRLGGAYDQDLFEDADAPAEDYGY
ncbi:hypothetical protein SEA_VINCENZO_75 [Mycobacterium phage Vincenzo]|uniref:Uncharacterized protein n=2 Tax=Coopervirus vincenzo TaxID=1983110 RepID=A0A0F6SJJ7_9CAUD|nr:hypothetical protein SEA_VINCENZO_75 [Mycobacterium phage Vincenzo]AKF14337.1 hypothetical protein SEA_VINCENZO_75 [Mycobacterium phage Vincenzo]AKF14741.1 hypothetical protein SEA_ALANGRANT_76 [Mycobacterium phage AlanGrant]